MQKKQEIFTCNIFIKIYSILRIIQERKTMANIKVGHKIIRKEKYEEHIYLNLDKFSVNTGLLQLFYICEGVLEGSGEYSFPHGNTQCFHLEFSEGGEFVFTRKKKLTKIENNSIYIEQPGKDKRSYTFRNPGKESCRRYALAIFPNSNFEPIFHLQERDIVRNADMEKFMKSFHALLNRLKDQKECSAEAISVNLFELLTYLTVSVPVKDNSLAGKRKEKLAIVQTFPQRFPDLKSLLDFFEVSRDTLYRIFKEYTAQSPMDFVIQARLLNSCWMLNETQYSIAEIARITGYATAAFYSNAYKKLFRISPSHCRKHGFDTREAKAALETVRKIVYHF